MEHQFKKIGEIERRHAWFQTVLHSWSLGITMIAMMGAVTEVWASFSCHASVDGQILKIPAGNNKYEYDSYVDGRSIKNTDASKNTDVLVQERIAVKMGICFEEMKFRVHEECYKENSTDHGHRIPTFKVLSQNYPAPDCYTNETGEFCNGKAYKAWSAQCINP